MKQQIALILAILITLACNTKQESISTVTKPDSLVIKALGLDSALQKDSINVALWVERAKIAEQLKDTTGAIGYYLEANSLYPSPEAMLSLANLLAETKDARAIIVTANIKKLYPYKSIDPDIHFINGIYWSRTGKHAQAIIAFDSSIRGNYRYYEAYMEKGFILYESKQYLQAKTIFATIISLNPSYADAYYWLAKLEEVEGNKVEAIKRYEQALQLDTSIKEAAVAIKRLNK